MFEIDQPMSALAATAQTLEKPARQLSRPGEAVAPATLLKPEELEVVVGKPQGVEATN